MDEKRKKYIHTFSRLVIILVIGCSLYFGIQYLAKENKKKNPKNWANVTVLKEIKKLPPGLEIEIENKGERTIGTSHFRLVFLVGEKTFCRVDRDIGGFEPGKTKLVLQCSDWNSEINARAYKLKVNYNLIVYFEMKKPIDMISGQFQLEN